VTESNEYITMLEASGPIGGAAESTAIAANYMHFDTGASVRRLSFSSSVVEHGLHLWDLPEGYPASESWQYQVGGPDPTQVRSHPVSS
jgi:hypothetical protein